MTDSRQSIEDQHGSPGADAPGDGAQRPVAAETLAPEALESQHTPAGAAAEPDSGAEGATTGPDGDGDVAEIEGDLDELVKIAAQRDEYLALAQRTQADFENYRKRVARESAGAQARGVAGLAKELLPALDNLDRALEAAAQDDPLLEGVRLVRSELRAALARVGIESFTPVGEAFDPALHEAMATTDQPVDGVESGSVVEVYQPGYRLGASIIRPARVVVAS
jgi:molecular chaperone GrpE